MAVLLIVAAVTLPSMAQAVLLAVAWLLPHVSPRLFLPATPQRRTAWVRFQPFAVFFVFLSVLIQGWFGEGPRLDLPYVSLSIQGVEVGLQISLRAVLILTGILIFFMPLQPLELAHWLTRLRLPVGIPIAILLSLQLVEDLPATIETIRRSQRSRGLRIDGSFTSRLRALRFLITPIVMRTLEGSLERATALQLRGLLVPIPIPLPRAQHGIIGAILFALAVLLLILRILQWTGLSPSIV
jgi:energy-coupling factor transporter transmembrane protein EcfT